MLTPYTPAEWEVDWEAGKRLACPRCGSDEDYGPRQSVLPGGRFHRYRGCKRCGLFQEADGQSAGYQTHLMAHDCTANVGADAQCRGCGARIRNGGPHSCRRIIRDDEQFICPECQTVLGEKHEIPWPNPGPWT